MSFQSIFSGKLYGILTWSQFDKIWGELAAGGKDWYVWSCDEDVPVQTMGKDEFLTFLGEANSFLVTQDRNKRCGFMYVDDMVAPSLLKVFDPKRMGTSCACSSDPVFPKWTISQMPPAPFEDDPVADMPKHKWWDVRRTRAC